jgi:glyoxylase-like metal-dependent hydrolase (beta-lactamase superfamily II)
MASLMRKEGGMRQINGVYELDIANSKVFFIEGEKNILVDTGRGPADDVVLDFMEQSGMRITSEEERKVIKEGAYSTIVKFIDSKNITLDAIICTHYHNDHTGNLKKLKDLLNVPVAMHPEDIPFVEGTKEIPAPSFVPPEILKHIKVDPCKVDIQLKDGEFFTDDVQIIHVEGHTRGSICLLVKEKVLIAGDCVVGKNEATPVMGPEELNPPIEMFSTDYAQALKSLKKLLNYSFSSILPSHGASIEVNGKEKLARMIGGIGEKS